MTPEGFIEVGVRQDLLVSGWVGLGLLVLTVIVVVVGDWWDEDGWLFAFLPGVFAVIATAAWLVLLFPFQGEYHHVYRVEGRVESVSNVLEGGSGDLTQTPVIELSTIDRPITMNDPRALSLDGKDVTLTCSIGWNYQAADTYSCSIYAIGDVR